jgi:hypothetical protein
MSMFLGNLFRNSFYLEETGKTMFLLGTVMSHAGYLIVNFLHQIIMYQNICFFKYVNHKVLRS